MPITFTTIPNNNANLDFVEDRLVLGDTTAFLAKMNSIFDKLDLMAASVNESVAGINTVAGEFSALDIDSTFDVAVTNGFTGTVEEWFLTLKGNQGDQGISAYDVAVENGFNGGVALWLASLNGRSAFAIALEGGFSGTEAQWLESLQGQRGQAGPSGGDSAYTIAVAGGYVGTEAEWLVSLNGDDGTTGASAYEVAVQDGFTGTVSEWLLSLKGNDGASGLRGAPVADVAALTALSASDFEIRYIDATNETVIFDLGAVAGDYQDDAQTGYWSIDVVLTAGGLRGSPVASTTELAALVPSDDELRRVGASAPYTYYVFVTGAGSGDIADNGTTGFWNIVTAPSGGGLRGAPVADVATLTALAANDFEIRYIDSTNETVIFDLGATSGGYQDDAQTGYWSVDVPTTSSGGSPDKAIFAHKVASGVASGDTVAGAWTEIPISVEVKNDIAGASISTNVITLPAGSYSSRGFCNFYRSTRSQIRVRDTTNSADLIIGSSTFSTATDVSVRSYFDGDFTLAATADIEVQYYCSSSRSPNGFGVDASTGLDELYSQILFEKVA